MKRSFLGFFIVIAVPALAQTTVNQVAANGDNPLRKFVKHAQIEHSTGVADRFSILAGQSDTSDSVIAKRSVLMTSLYKNGAKLSNAEAVKLLQTAPGSLTRYRWGKLIRPLGPLVSLAGLGVAYVAIKGTQETAIVRGKGSKATPIVPDVQVEYTKRSTPKLLAGLGLFVGGMCLVELSNELVAKSAATYNASLGQLKKISFVQSVRVGITPEGNVGLYARF